MMSIRTAHPADHPTIVDIAVRSGLFDADDAAFFGESLRETTAGAVLFIDGDRQGAAMLAPEPMSDAAWNLLFLAVDPSAQRGGIGRALVTESEAHARAAGGRMLLIDTASIENQAAARALYAALGFGHVATIPGYYGDGVDRLTYLKRL
ncbi:GNAT family N-acetyltransferase [uncultured Jannaschia sp.]|uniref:GNAT family N-acetyltransferase n=1 Tax=uncultured Jannaschia sp. TaxID=293347 RepID=UPI00262F8E29|nr:GNAT family N-acetyltransferase [uncultured Jannaschia sp.]